MKNLFTFIICLIPILSISTIINIPHDFSTIQEGIDAAVDADIVLVQPDTYVENINYNGKNITVASLFLTTADTTYISQTIIDGSQPLNPDSSSVVTFCNSENSHAVLTGFTLTNGSGTRLNYNPHFGPYFSGGGIYCGNTDPTLKNLVIINNASDYGGGIYLNNSNPHLEKVIISNNSASGIIGYWGDNSGSGGGIVCSNFSSPSLNDVTISNNSSNYIGGGMYCESNSNPYLENTTLAGNSATDSGGGICCVESDLNFDPINRCNIFLNHAGIWGCDLYAYECNTIDLILDTFTVSQPDDYFAYPLDNFTFDILNGKVEPVSQDIYVSPTGSNENSGLSVDDPLRTIYCALAKVLPDSPDTLSIHLLNGIYSSSTNGEMFPINCRSYISLVGEEQVLTILDGEGLNSILYIQGDDNFSIMNLTIKNGIGLVLGGGIYCVDSSLIFENVTISENIVVGGQFSQGGGIYCENSNLNLTNLLITDNHADQGGGIFCGNSNLVLTNLLITGNSAFNWGGGIYCGPYSSPSLTNVTISGNTAGHGGGIYCDYYSDPSLINTILWNDLPQEVYFGGWSGSISITISYSDIQGGEEGIVTNNNGEVYWLEGNIDEDPLFVDPEEDDYHLTENSPCIDAGDPFYPPDPDGTRSDMGAFYFHHTGGEVEVFADFYTDTTSVQIMLPVQFYDSSVSFYTEITSWLWDFDNDGSYDSFEQNPVYTYQNPCYYTVSLTVEDDQGNSDTMVKNNYIFAHPPIYNGHIFHIDQEGADEWGNGSLEYPFATIQHGISIAADNDTILVHPGTYFENINFSGKNITIGSLFLTTQDTTYISQTIIDGNENGSVVTYANEEDSTAILAGFTITNGNAIHGGGVYCGNSNPTLRNITIIDNSAFFGGGGIYCNFSNPSLKNVIISGNFTQEHGGGFFCSNAVPILENVIIKHNYAFAGGGIYCVDNSSPNLLNVTILNNYAINKGGGIYCYNNSNPIITNAIISDNSTGSCGCGIYSDSSILTLTNVTISDNSADFHGGGIYCHESDADLSNCILWNDTPQEIYFSINSVSNTITISYSDIQGGEDGIVINNSTLNWLEGNIDENPLFVGIGDHPYSLLDGSTCIDAGIPDTLGLNLPPWDIIGNERIWDGDGDGIAVIDMGAYEYGAPPYVDVNDNIIVQIPGVYLYQNYPNPFNPTTTISFSVTQTPSSVELNIYNLKGQKVKTFLINPSTLKPINLVTWNGTNDNNKPVSSGIYFYKLKADDLEKVKKMILMK